MPGKVTGFAGPILERVAIGELNASYGHAVSTHDLGFFRSLWAPDAIWTHPYFDRLDGIDAIAQVVAGAFDTYPLLVYVSEVGALHVTEETAFGSVYVSELTGGVDGQRARVTGRYDDEYRRTSGGWLFARRDYSIFDVSPVPVRLQ